MTLAVQYGYPHSFFGKNNKAGRVLHHPHLLFVSLSNQWMKNKKHKKIGHLNGDLGSEREDFKKEMKVPLSSDLDPDYVGEASYGLRENPNKSWKISDSKHSDLKKLNLCKCGKGFPSLRALSGLFWPDSMALGRQLVVLD